MELLDFWLYLTDMRYGISDNVVRKDKTDNTTDNRTNYE